MLTAKTSAPLKNVVIHFMAVPPFTLDLVTHVSAGLSPVLVPPLAAAAAPGLPGLSVEAGLGLVLLSELLRLLFAADVSVGRLDRPAGSVSD